MILREWGENNLSRAMDDSSWKKVLNFSWQSIRVIYEKWSISAFKLNFKLDFKLIIKQNFEFRFQNKGGKFQMKHKCNYLEGSKSYIQIDVWITFWLHICQFI